MAKRTRKPFKLIPILLTAIIVTIAVGAIVKLAPLLLQQTPSQQTVAASGPFKDNSDNPALARQCPVVRKYQEAWLTGPITTNSKISCYDTCSLDFINRANSAYSHPQTEDSTRKRIDNWLSGVDEREGEGGKVYETMAACFNDTPDPSTGPISEGAGGTLDYPTFTLLLSNKPAESNDGKLDAQVRYVTLIYPNPPPTSAGDNKYYYCLKSNPQDCDDDDLKDATYDSSKNLIKINKLCGNGNNKLKANDDCKDDGTDYFHPERIYRVTFYEKKKADSAEVASASFYVSRFYPNIIQPKEEAEPRLNINQIKGTKAAAQQYYDLKVTLDGRNTWADRSVANGDQYNDYWLVVEGFDNDYQSESKCLYVGGSGQGTATIRLSVKPEGSVDELTAGKYLLKIKDAINGKLLTSDNPQCQENDFTYWFIPFTIAAGDKSGTVSAYIKDPYGKEIGYQGAQSAPAPICPTGFKNSDGNCTRISTALGTIRTEPIFFIRDLFRLVLGIGGIAAVVFFIQAGYTVMTSAGNKEKVGQAREQITAAVMGLIFIILSVTILEFIGVNILQLPGFGPSAPESPAAAPTIPPGGIENDPDLRSQDPILNP